MKGFVLLILVSISFSILPGQTYKPDNRMLYDTIVYLDSIFFNAYNTCDMELQSEFYSENIEFYHDLGGLSTSKQDILNAIRNNICDKVTRERLKESIEVYPIANYGAVEMGLHRFYNKV
ncbi:MAG TPA: nuclear transport factor 2 family protein, partial [Bacteroidales bacterium]|nr:nuclear transport factor 2 family protein [Bacteroidales bacterium]